jgi:transcriptional regulator with XRE-family HTH domain
MKRLVSVLAGDGYSPDEMPQAKRGTGPWGDAIQHWLNERKWRQADLAKATQIGTKTISQIVRGFHTQTRVLEEIARKLDVPLDRVLVSPLRRGSDEDRRGTIRKILMDALRAVDADGMEVEDEVLALAKRMQQLPPHLRDSLEEMLGQYEKLGIKPRARKLRRRA